jgi:hypothetical protein
MSIYKTIKPILIDFSLHSAIRHLYIKHNVILDAFYSVEKDCIHVRWLVAPVKARRQGYGTRSLNLIKHIAVFFHTNIILLPDAIADVPLKQVVAFYVKNNFVPIGEDGYYCWYVLNR